MPKRIRLTTPAAIERLAAELPSALALLPVIGAGCGLRPGELLAVSWKAIDLARGTLSVCASVADGEVRTTLKTRRSRRTVPLRAKVAEALAAALDHRPGTGLMFCSRAGSPLDLRSVRRRAWRGALQRAGFTQRHRPYDLRHTYDTWSLRAGVGVYQLARRMGTSVEMIDATYGHLAIDADEHERYMLDAFDRGGANTPNAGSGW